MRKATKVLRYLFRGGRQGTVRRARKKSEKGEFGAYQVAHLVKFNQKLILMGK